MTARDRACANQDIRNAFLDFYKSNILRFQAMYANSITIQGNTLEYTDMLPDKTKNEMPLDSTTR
jgi:hypothetical protein